MSVATQTFEFRAEIQQLLNILVHSLYTDREIFLRELVSNASDALNRLQFEMLTRKDVVDPQVEPAIRISVDKEGKKITISDTGIGMNRDEMIENLGTIAHSGAMSFMQAIKERGTTPTTEIIGQFGVGFYSVFMVADKVSVTSRSYRPEDAAYTWTSDGSNAYTIEPSARTERGTEIVIHVKEDADEFLDEFRLRNIVQKHSNYISFPIHIGDKVANAQTALWRRSRNEIKEQEYHEFYKQLTYDPGRPMLHLHLAADAPVQFYALLFVPSKLDRGLLSAEYNAGPRLYARKVLIQERSKELLPEWMRFIEGVVDSEDLPLNISRETVQSNRVMQRLKTTLSGKMIGEMEQLAEKDSEAYNVFWREFGRMLKEGIFTDGANRDRLAGLLRFRTSRKPDGWVSLKEYVENMVEGQEHIYYLFGDNIQAIQRSPHLDVFKARNIEVLLMTETIDSFMINGLVHWDNRKLHNGADADLQLPGKPEDQKPESEPLPENTVEGLVKRFGDVLGERVSNVRTSDLLTESPVRLVSADQGFGADMERVYKMLDREFVLPKRILEINPRHALIRSLAEQIDSPLTELIVEQLFESALLMEGIHPSPVEMLPRIQKIMEAAAKRG